LKRGEDKKFKWKICRVKFRFSYVIANPDLDNSIDFLFSVNDGCKAGQTPEFHDEYYRTCKFSVFWKLFLTVIITKSFQKAENTQQSYAGTA
jgi:hypothetical protein